MQAARNIIVPNDEHPTYKELIEWVEIEFISDALRQTGGNIRQARLLLRMPRASMVLKMKRFNIDANDFK